MAAQKKNLGGTFTAVCFVLVGWLLAGGVTQAAETVAVGVDFAAAKPILARYCLDCHSGDAAEAEVDLSFTHDATTLGKHAKLLQRVEEMVTSGQMPPPESDQLTDEERRVLADWLLAFLAAKARAHAGDPGRVVLRRLNNAEYTNTIRDLTGVDVLDPAKEFPADGGAGEGFTNTGQSLVMSPSLATSISTPPRESQPTPCSCPMACGFRPATPAATLLTRRSFASRIFMLVTRSRSTPPPPPPSRP